MLNALRNPFALVGQGFLLGGLLVLVANDRSLEAVAQAPAPASMLDSLPASR